MEFEKINLEKSWNFVSDLILFESKFAHFKYPEYMPLCILLLYIDFSKISLYVVINYDVHELM